MDEDNKFRRSLKSPVVMIGLCIVAGITVYHNVIESTMDSSLPVSVASTPPPSAQSPITIASSLTGHDEVATQWIDHPARDPFAPMSVTKWSTSSSKPSTTSTFSNMKPQGSSRNTLRLKAVAIEAQQRSAVINRRVVYEGEMIEGYKIVSIQLKGVWLKRHGKKQFLTFATNTTS